jgi:hypothetical protein
VGPRGQGGKSFCQHPDGREIPYGLDFSYEFSLGTWRAHFQESESERWCMGTNAQFHACRSLYGLKRFIQNRLLA